MPTLVHLDPPIEDIIAAEIASGRFANAIDVVRLAEAGAGETTDMDVVFDELDRELQGMVARPT